MVNTSIFMQLRTQMARQAQSINTLQLCWKVLKKIQRLCYFKNIQINH